MRVIFWPVVAGAYLVGAAMSLYLLILTVAGWLRPMTAATTRNSPNTRFAVLIPAHNEAQLLPRLLDDLQAQDYPHLSVFVVADNCTDDTPNVARARNATVFERHDLTSIGKGYALQWLLERLRPRRDEFDAYAFIDGDCRISSGFFQVMDAHLQRGERSIQASYSALDPFVSGPAILRHLALVLKHDVRSRGKAALGLPCGLFGTGMVFARDVVEQHGWQAFGLAEDAEHQMTLLLSGIRTTHAPDARVWGEMPDSLPSARSQNMRWEAGRLSATRRLGPAILRHAITRRRWKDADALIEQAFPPVSLVGACVVLGALLTLPLRAPAWLTFLAWGNLAAFVTHVVGGLLLWKAPVRAYRALLYLPVFAIWKIAVYTAALSPKSRKWEPTRPS